MAIIQKVEILSALKKLNEKLTEDESEFLAANMNNNMKQFEVASSNIGQLTENLNASLIFENNVCLFFQFYENRIKNIECSWKQNKRFELKLIENLTRCDVKIFFNFKAFQIYY